MFQEPHKEAIVCNNSFEESPLQALTVLLQNKLLLYAIYGIIFSYFYNLAIINYSVTGDNELRLYDVLGILVLYNYYKYNALINVVIQKVPFFKILKKFMIWASITMVLTLVFHVLNDKILSFLQVVLTCSTFGFFI